VLKLASKGTAVKGVSNFEDQIAQFPKQLRASRKAYMASQMANKPSLFRIAAGKAADVTESGRALGTHLLRGREPGLFSRFGAKLAADKPGILGDVSYQVHKAVDKSPKVGKMYQNLVDTGYEVTGSLRGRTPDELRRLGLVGNRAPPSLKTQILRDMGKASRKALTEKNPLKKIGRIASLPFALERALNPYAIGKRAVMGKVAEAEDLAQLKAVRKAGKVGAAAEDALKLKTLKVMPAGVDNLGGLVKRTSKVDKGLGAASSVVKKLGLKPASKAAKVAGGALPIVGGFDDMVRAGHHVVDFAKDPSLKSGYTTAVGIADGLISTFGGGILDTAVALGGMASGKEYEERPQGVASWLTDKLKVDKLFGVTGKDKFKEGGLDVVGDKVSELI